MTASSSMSRCPARRSVRRRCPTRNARSSHPIRRRTASPSSMRGDAIPARQHGRVTGRRWSAAGPQLRHRRRGRLDPHRRGPHAAHHLRAGLRRRRPLRPVRPHRSGPRERAGLRGRREEATVAITEEGITRVEEALGVENLYDNINQNFVHQLQAALRAKELFKRDVDYVVADGEVKIVDEFTGRILEGRRWSRGPPPGRRGQGEASGSRKRTRRSPPSRSRTTSGSTRSCPA